MTEDIIKEIISLLSETSPIVWRIFLKQVYIDVYLSLAWVVTLAVIIFILAFPVRRFVIKKADEEGDSLSDWTLHLFIIYIISPVCFIVTLILITEAVSKLSNPEYYAIQYLLRTFN